MPRRRNLRRRRGGYVYGRQWNRTWGQGYDDYSDDRGANDEYWSKWCETCRVVTDHDCSGCAECHNREVRYRG